MGFRDIHQARTLVQPWKRFGVFALGVSTPSFRMAVYDVESLECGAIERPDRAAISSRGAGCSNLASAASLR